MPINGYSVGRDTTLDIIDPQVGTLRFNKITEFQSKQDVTDIKVKGIDGITEHVTFADGWSGSFSIERQDATLDKYFSRLEQDYYSGLNRAAATITQTIQEADGSITTFRYLKVVFKLDDAGSWAGDKTVKQKISFMASRRPVI